MTGFSADWLALREPFDVAARDRALAVAFLAHVPRDGRIVDLGAGAGSNIGYLRGLDAGRLWRHVDDDPALLAVARSRFAADPRIELVRLDLAAALEVALGDAAAVTCAALLDLVSASWLAELADALARRRLPLLAVLTYDGRMVWEPEDTADTGVAAAFHRDMARDKGFGAALGPRAADHLADLLRARGASVTLRPSDWRIGAPDVAMLDAMRDGVGAAAAASAPPGDRDAVAGWQARRAAARPKGLVVGHLDLSAVWD
jgi:hypothetical protein